jgi:hypothetical protein
LIVHRLTSPVFKRRTRHILGGLPTKGVDSEKEIREATQTVQRGPLNSAPARVRGGKFTADPKRVRRLPFLRRDGDQAKSLASRTLGE